MKNTKILLNNNAITLTNYKSINNSYSGAFFDRPIAIVLIIMLSPILMINATLALLTNNSIFSINRKVDSLGRPMNLHYFSMGMFKKTGILFDVFNGNIGMCGLSFNQSISAAAQFAVMNQIKVKAGIYSLYDLHTKTGLAITSEEDLLEEQLNGSATNYMTLMIKSILCTLLYGRSTTKLKKSNILSLFGLHVKNTSMKEAVKWITNNKTNANTNENNGKTKIGFFVNVHSINLSISNPTFQKQLTKADALFADGSGMRLAAASAGFLLKGNNNGTDLLPHLCRRCIKNKQSLYLLGAKPGVARKAAENLQKKHTRLTIAGTEHGYTNFTDEELVADINNSKCDVLLVAMGSPIQEQWLIDNQDKLTCKTALAVGGLFDFYSGDISRAPLWLREIGMEWVWRLMQEPKAKFNRYVIGTPLFLYRTFFLGLATLENK